MSDPFLIKLGDLGLFKTVKGTCTLSQYDWAHSVAQQFSECMHNAYNRHDCIMPGICARAEVALDCAHLRVNFEDGTSSFGKIPLTGHSLKQIEHRLRHMGAHVAKLIGEADEEAVERARALSSQANRDAMAGLRKRRPPTRVAAKPEKKRFLFW